MSGIRTHTNVVDQSIATLKSFNPFIETGFSIFSITDKLAAEITQADGGDEERLTYLKNTMLSFCKMEREVKQFIDAATFAKNQADSADSVDFEQLLDDRLETLRNGNKEADLAKHKRYLDMLDHLSSSSQNDESSTDQSEVQLDDDMTMVPAAVNTICPYTLQEMSRPVRNKLCNHNYDYDGIMEFIKNRGRKAKCPVSGCINDKPLDPSNLEDNTELKKVIERKSRTKNKK